eukprot:CAMPEP_0184694970 /NCGR_PEP_ID=MMETSP0313-20130426/2745_1 /TAXON_ID=2792 /ORGANISM="Porphyridium aerugineum, Strain SAG 1380-2" /LENGTH=1407 /DNA_ID=CAMNT_0027153339 /DNA_START=60 /DNA_END=4283 /DNA_ORIENTATION=-
MGTIGILRWVVVFILVYSIIRDSLGVESVADHQVEHGISEAAIRRLHQKNLQFAQTSVPRFRDSRPASKAVESNADALLFSQNKNEFPDAGLHSTWLQNKSTAIVDFGVQWDFSLSWEVVHLVNPTGQNVHIYSVSSSDPVFEVYALQDGREFHPSYNQPKLFCPSCSLSLHLRFHPELVGEYRSTLRIFTSIGNVDLVRLRGKAIQNPFGFYHIFLVPSNQGHGVMLFQHSLRLFEFVNIKSLVLYKSDDSLECMLRLNERCQSNISGYGGARISSPPLISRSPHQECLLIQCRGSLSSVSVGILSIQSDTMRGPVNYSDTRPGTALVDTVQFAVPIQFHRNNPFFQSPKDDGLYDLLLGIDLDIGSVLVHEKASEFKLRYPLLVRHQEYPLSWKLKDIRVSSALLALVSVSRTASPTILTSFQLCSIIRSLCGSDHFAYSKLGEVMLRFPKEVRGSRIDLAGRIIITLEHIKTQREQTIFIRLKGSMLLGLPFPDGDYFDICIPCGDLNNSLIRKLVLTNAGAEPLHLTHASLVDPCEMVRVMDFRSVTLLPGEPAEVMQFEVSSGLSMKQMTEKGCLGYKTGIEVVFDGGSRTLFPLQPTDAKLDVSANTVDMGTLPLEGSTSPKSVAISIQNSNVFAVEIIGIELFPGSGSWQWSPPIPVSVQRPEDQGKRLSMVERQKALFNYNSFISNWTDLARVSEAEISGESSPIVMLESGGTILFRVEAPQIRGDPLTKQNLGFKAKLLISYRIQRNRAIFHSDTTGVLSQRFDIVGRFTRGALATESKVELVHQDSVKWELVYDKEQWLAFNTSRWESCCSTKYIPMPDLAFHEKRWFAKVFEGKTTHSRLGMFHLGYDTIHRNGRVVQLDSQSSLPVHFCLQPGTPNHIDNEPGRYVQNQVLLLQSNRVLWKVGLHVDLVLNPSESFQRWKQSKMYQQRKGISIIATIMAFAVCCVTVMILVLQLLMAQLSRFRTYFQELLEARRTAVIMKSAKAEEADWVGREDKAADSLKDEVSNDFVEALAESTVPCCLGLEAKSSSCSSGGLTQDEITETETGDKKKAMLEPVDVITPEGSPDLSSVADDGEWKIELPRHAHRTSFPGNHNQQRQAKSRSPAKPHGKEDHKKSASKSRSGPSLGHLQSESKSLESSPVRTRKQSSQGVVGTTKPATVVDNSKASLSINRSPSLDGPSPPPFNIWRNQPNRDHGEARSRVLGEEGTSVNRRSRSTSSEESRDRQRAHSLQSSPFRGTESAASRGNPRREMPASTSSYLPIGPGHPARYSQSTSVFQKSPLQHSIKLSQGPIQRDLIDLENARVLAESMTSDLITDLDLGNSVYDQSEPTARSQLFPQDSGSLHPVANASSQAQASRYSSEYSLFGSGNRSSANPLLDSFMRSSIEDGGTKQSE